MSEKPSQPNYRLTRKRLDDLLTSTWAPLHALIEGRELESVKSLNRLIRERNQKRPDARLSTVDRIAADDELVLQFLLVSLHEALRPEAWQQADTLLEPLTPYLERFVETPLEALWSAWLAQTETDRKADVLSLLIRLPALSRSSGSPRVDEFRAMILNYAAGEDDSLRELAFQYLTKQPLTTENRNLLLAALPYVQRALDRHTRANYLLHLGRLEHIAGPSLDQIETQARQLRHVVPRDPMLPDFDPPGYLIKLARLHRGYRQDGASPDWDWMIERVEQDPFYLEGLTPEAFVYTVRKPRAAAEVFRRMLTLRGVNGEPGLNVPMATTVDVMTALAAQGHLPAWACRHILNKLKTRPLEAKPVDQCLSWLRLGALTSVRDLLWTVLERPGLVRKANVILLCEVLERAWGSETELATALKQRMQEPIAPANLAAYADLMAAQPAWSRRLGLEAEAVATDTRPVQGGLQHG